jgi:hypothetical protein
MLPQFSARRIWVGTVHLTRGTEIGPPPAFGIWASPQGRFPYFYAKDGTFDAAKLGTPAAARIPACRL